MRDQYLSNGVKVKLTEPYPGKPGIVDTRKGWSIENEIEWAESQLFRAQRRVGQLYLERKWWEDFIEYCNSPCWRVKLDYLLY